MPIRPEYRGSNEGLLAFRLRFKRQAQAEAGEMPLDYGRLSRSYAGTGKYRRGQKSGAVRAARALVVAAQRVARRPRVSNARTGGLLGLENKFLDVSHSGVMASGTSMVGLELDPATLLCLNAVVQGDGASERDGRKIHMTNITVGGNITVAAVSAQTTLPPPATITLMLVMDTQTNAAQLNSEDVVVNPSGDANSNSFAPRDLEFQTRFRILRTWQKVMPQRTTGNDAAGTYDINGVTMPFKLSANLKTNVSYKIGGTTAVIANIVDNSVHLIGWLSNANQTVTITYNSRLRFRG